MIVDDTLGEATSDTQGAETGLCFFANQQIDRSPTGGGVCARMALAHAKGRRPVGQRRTYNSLVSNMYAGNGSFVGMNVEEVSVSGGRGLSSKGVVVQVEGQVYCTGAATFVLEEDKMSGAGFFLQAL